MDLTPQLAGAYTLWLRARAAGKPGRWQISLDRKPAGHVAVEKGAWTWVRLDGPLKLEAGKRQRLALASADEGLAVDKLILTTDPRTVPQTLDDRFRTPPKKLEYLVPREVTESSVHLAWWNPTAEPDLDYYSVYAGDSPDFPADQAHLIASTRRTEVLDWGLAPAARTTYKVVAFNRRGLASEPAAITVQTRPVEKRVLLELPIEMAKLDPRLKRETRGGVKYAFRPYPGKGHEKDPPADISWELPLAVAGRYTIWCQYAPADYGSSALRVPVLLDDFLDGKATWRMRSPYRDMRGPAYRLWKEDLWFVDKVTMYVWPRPRDLFRLAAGTHRLTLRLSPRMREFHHKIGRLWVTNDPSFRPPGWDPQADFRKSAAPRK